MNNVVSMNACLKPRPDSRAPSFLADYELSSSFQPIFSPTHQRLVGYEALVRVGHRGRQLPPPQLFERAREVGRIETLDQQLINLHLGNFGQSERPAWLFLNINPDTCTQATPYLEELARQCQQAGIEPGQVVLEVVETTTDKTRALMDFVDGARQRGFQIAIDDFGTGDSNFERMWRLNPLIVKMDRSLLVNAEQHPRARQLLTSLVRMIRESGSLVLLEGIETEAQAKIALATEADLMQGFLFARPNRFDAFIDSPLESRFSHAIERFRRHSRQDVADHEGYLRLLRMEVMSACHSLVRETAFNDACASLLTVAGVKRCFLLNQAGVQQGELAIDFPQRRTHDFNPLFQSGGACWEHREYFRNALSRPYDINASRPYVALPDAIRTVTLSCGLQMKGKAMVFCVDLHPDAVFDGHLRFPDTL